MVKVRIEYNGKVREFEEDAVIAFFPDKESARMIFTGKTSIKRVMGMLSVGVPRILENASDSRMEYVDAMIKVHDEIDKKIKEELKAGGIHPLVDALVKAMGEELEK